MSDKDTFPASEPDNPRDMTPDDLEDALRWLEELAGKQGKNLDGLITLDDATVEDSPFKGLFDSDEQAIPDWLREMPSLIGDESEIQEGESALDWLARMANRELVQELPTLEWRRLTEGEEVDDVVEALPETAAAIAGLPSPDADVAPAPAAKDTPTPVAAPTDPPPVVGLMKDMAVAEAAVAAEAAAENDPAEVATDTIPTPIVDEAPPPAVVAPETAIAPAESEVLLAELQLGLSEAGVPPDDLDDAMAWLEELAASQDAPIEDLPSVADRALASKLIAEATSGRSEIEGLDVSQLGIALSGIYVGQTKLAPEGPLVGQGPADETPDSAIHAEMALALEPDAGESKPEASGVLTAVDMPAPVVTELDVAIVDAVAEPEASVEPDPRVEDAVEWTALEPAAIEPLISAHASLDASAAEDSLADLMNAAPSPALTLAEQLAAVDQLAVPASTSLSEIRALLDADPIPVKVTPFSLESTLDWLERGRNGAPGDILDAGLVAALPDDPDEAQAWLEELAGEPEAGRPAASPAMIDAVSALDLTEADLLDMPEDPDAAIAWIESLAARREQAGS